jgi:hypothetical protein
MAEQVLLTILCSGVERRGEGCPLEQEALQQADSSMAVTYIIKHEM